MSDRLIPANTTLLQPLSQYYRISDAVNQIYAMIAQLQRASGAIAPLEKQADLQAQIDALNARLTKAGIT